MQEFSNKYGLPVFNYGLGFMLLNVEMPTWSMWIITALLVVLGSLALAQFGSIARFWGAANKNPDLYGPNGELHKRGKFMFDRTNHTCYDYQDQHVFWISVACSIMLMGGLLHQGWYVALAFEFAASVIGFAVIRAYLTNFPHYYSLINGKELPSA